jgi:anti-sigma-K factor RskA
MSEGRRTRRVSTWLVAAAAASALFAGGVLVGRQSTPADQFAGPSMDSILAVASAGDANYMPVDLMGSQARVVVSDEMSKVAVLASDLPMPAMGQCYQVWKVAPDGTKTSAGVFTPDDDGHVAVVLEGGPDVAGFVVTLEPPGGSKEPTGEMVGQVTA